MLWTEEMERLVVKLWFADKSATDVATEMSVKFDARFTKNMVLGKLNRMIAQGRLGRRADYRPVKHVVAPRAEKEQKVVAKKVVVARPAVPQKPSLPKLPPMSANIIELRTRGIPQPGKAGVTIDQASGCLYAISETEKGVHLFCNALKKDNSAYCEKHHKMCHSAAPVRTKIPLRLVR